MRIVGIGTDLVAIGRFQRLITRGGRRFLEHWFTQAEMDYCLAGREPARHAAGGFAAKEAALKAMQVHGLGIPKWREIEVARGEGGLPELRTHGPTRELVKATGITDFHLSLADDGEYATATVLAVAALRGSHSLTS